MSYRPRSYAPPAPAPVQGSVQVPSALRLMMALVVAFVLITLLVLFAGRVPFRPAPIPQPGTPSSFYTERDTTLLSTYGYTMEGTVHIPIDRAMELIVERGLPVREDAAPTP